MADSLRGQLVPLVLCCVSQSLVGLPPAAAESLPPLQVDPSLLGPMPARPLRVPTVEAPPPTPARPAQTTPAPQPVPVAPRDALPATPARAPKPATPADTLPFMPRQTTDLNSPVGGTGTLAGGQPMLPGPRRVEDERPKENTPKPSEPPAPLPQPVLKPTARITPVSKDMPYPSFLSGDRIRSEGGNQVTVEGAAEMRQTAKILRADRISYFQDLDEAEAEGKVRLYSEGNLISGPKMRRKMDAATGYFDQPDYVLRTEPQPGQALDATTGYGHAERLEFEGEDRYRLKKATYTTCSPTDPDWYTQSDDLFLDYTRMVGEGRHGKVIFKGVPILYSPMLDFSLSNGRKSGFLTPTLGTSSTSGVDATLPYYWNIAPHMDATLSPRMLGRRGVQLGTEFRYLQPYFSGIARYEYLPRDTIFGAARRSYSLVHNQNLGHGFSANVDVNGVSDNSYFTDLSSSITSTAQTLLLRQGYLAYSASWWSAVAGVQRYQSLQAGPPYDRLPYVSLFASRPNFVAGTAFTFTGNFDSFAVKDSLAPNRPEGARTVLYPQLSLPLEYSGVSITPKVGYHVSHYGMSKVALPGNATSFRRAVPLYSIDSTVSLERDMQWDGRRLTQTLEPRLYYLYVPYRDQSRYPVFDSGLSDFNFAQIFAENIYAGNDRIADANQLTAALTSRIIDPQTGAQVMQAAIGQRLYFRTQGVTLPGEVPRTSSKADILAAFTGNILPKVYVDSAWQYNPRDKQTQRASFGGRYQPEALKLLNLGYRFRRDTVPGQNDGLRDADLSAQWPLGGRWYGLGRYNYSLRDRHAVESLGGVEYDGGCWVGRFVAQRFATTTQARTTTLFFQLELNGFSRLGSDPGDVLRRTIGGYGRVNEIRNAPLFGVE